MTTRGGVRHDTQSFREDDAFVFGCETSGLPEAVLAEFDAKLKEGETRLVALGRDEQDLLRLLEELRDIFALPLLAARRALDAWLAYASRSKLPAFVKLARTIRAYRPAIEATIEWRLTNGIAESNNASIGRIRTNARGFHNPRRSSP